MRGRIVIANLAPLRWRPASPWQSASASISLPRASGQGANAPLTGSLTILQLEPRRAHRSAVPPHAPCAGRPRRGVRVRSKVPVTRVAPVDPLPLPVLRTARTPLLAARIGKWGEHFPALMTPTTHARSLLAFSPTSAQLRSYRPKTSRHRGPVPPGLTVASCAVSTTPTSSLA